MARRANHLEDPLISGGVVDGLVAVVRGVGVAPHRQDVQVRVTDPRDLKYNKNIFGDAKNINLELFVSSIISVWRVNKQPSIIS